jgi:hypothetical protein
MSKPHVFISYAHQDQERVGNIVRALKAEQVPLWIDQEIRAGSGWLDEMEAVLNEARVIVFCISPSFLASDWANVEIGMAISRSRKSAVRVLPLIVRNAVIPEWLDKFEFLDATKLRPEDVAREVKRIADKQQKASQDCIQFYSCFISYNTKDEEFARRLHGRLRDAGLRTWFAPEDLRPGNKLHEQIEVAIRVYDKLLIVLSEASLRSEWVKTELRNARKAERQSGKRKLFPLRLMDFETLRDWQALDPASGKDLAEELRQYFIPNFSHWEEDDQFELAFSRLLQDLKADDRRA